MGQKRRGEAPQPPSDIPPEYADAYLRAFQRAYEQTTEAAPHSLPSQGRSAPSARRRTAPEDLGEPAAAAAAERGSQPTRAIAAPTPEPREVEPAQQPAPEASASEEPAPQASATEEPAPEASATEEPALQDAVPPTPAPSAEELVARWTAATAPTQPAPDPEPAPELAPPTPSSEPVVTSVARTGPEAEAASFKPWVFEPPDPAAAEGAQTGVWAFEPPVVPGSLTQEGSPPDAEPNWVDMVPGFGAEDVDSWEPSEAAAQSAQSAEPPQQTPQPLNGPWVEEADWPGYRSTAPRWLIPLLTIVLLAVLSAAVYVLGR